MSKISKPYTYLKLVTASLIGKCERIRPTSGEHGNIQSYEKGYAVGDKLRESHA